MVEPQGQCFREKLTFETEISLLYKSSTNLGFTGFQIMLGIIYDL